jgi:hypothetical protein
MTNLAEPVMVQPAAGATCMLLDPCFLRMLSGEQTAARSQPSSTLAGAPSEHVHARGVIHNKRASREGTI